MRLVCTLLAAAAVFAAAHRADAQTRLPASAQGPAAVNAASYSEPHIHPVAATMGGANCNCAPIVRGGYLRCGSPVEMALADVSDTLDAVFGAVAFELRGNHGCDAHVGCDSHVGCDAKCGGSKCGTPCCGKRFHRQKFDHCFGGCHGENLWSGYCASKKCGCGYGYGGAHPPHELHHMPNMRSIESPRMDDMNDDLLSPPRPPMGARVAPLLQAPLTRAGGDVPQATRSVLRAPARTTTTREVNAAQSEPTEAKREFKVRTASLNQPIENESSAASARLRRFFPVPGN